MAAVTTIAAAVAIPSLVTGRTPPAPGASTGKASDVESISALVHGTVRPNGFATTYKFRYGPTTEYGRQTAPATIPSGTAPVAVEARLSGLQPGVEYHYRLVATNEFGAAEGDDRTFRSTAPTLDGVFRVEIRVTAGGRPFGQHRGDGGVRRYRFRARCAPRVRGGCADVRLRRSAQRGKFASLLSERGSGRWGGIETHHGYCDNGLEFRSRTEIDIRATRAAAAGRVNRITGQIHTVVRGCVSGSERAVLTGRPL